MTRGSRPRRRHRSDWLEGFELFSGEVLCRRKDAGLFWNDLVLVPMPATETTLRHLLAL